MHQFRNDSSIVVQEMESSVELYNETWTGINQSIVSMFNVVKTFKYISDEDRFLIVVIFNCFICIPICLVGVVANIINMAVFVRQGFSDSINISLLCLAMADLGSLVTLLWRNILYIPFIGQSNLPFDPVALIYLTGGMPHVCMVRISGCITAFVAFERCICIAWPLKVRRIFTHSRTIFINAVIFVVSIGAVSPVYYTSRLNWKFSPTRNRTILGLTYTNDRAQVESASFVANGIFLPMSAFLVDIVCTIIMMIKLHSQAQWRMGTASSKGEDSNASADSSSKDVRIMKMVMAISIIFIVCSLPINVNFVWMLLDPEFSIEGQYVNTMLVCATLSFLCEAINSSLNYFVYSRMSTKFRSTYVQMFNCQGRSCKSQKSQ